MPTRFEITTKTILYALLLVGAGWLLIQIRDILLLLFISFIFMSALRPLVDWFERLRLPRVAAVFIVYIIVGTFLFGFGRVLLPPLISETGRLVTHLPEYLAQAAPFVRENIVSFIQQVGPLGQNVVRVTYSVFSNVISVLSVAVFTFYFLLESKNLREFLDMFLGVAMGEKFVTIVRHAELRLGSWVRGELLLMLIIGLATYLGLTLLGINYALPLAIFAGLLEVVPIIGPIISGVPAVLVALTISPGLALAAVALYFIIQQLENNLIVPQVMQRAVGMPPLASLIALMVGGQLAGTVGIILAVPVLLVIQTVIQDLTAAQKRK